MSSSGSGSPMLKHKPSRVLGRAASQVSLSGSSSNNNHSGNNNGSSNSNDISNNNDNDNDNDNSNSNSNNNNATTPTASSAGASPKPPATESWTTWLRRNSQSQLDFIQAPVSSSESIRSFKPNRVPTSSDNEHNTTHGDRESTTADGRAVGSAPSRNSVDKDNSATDTGNNGSNNNNNNNDNTNHDDGDGDDKGNFKPHASIHSQESIMSRNSKESVNDRNSVGNEQQTPDQTKQDTYWTTWRRTSRSSAEGNIDDQAANGRPKQIFEEGQNGKPVRSQREGSWSFWKNSSYYGTNSTTASNPLTNIILSTTHESQEAVIYEPEDSSKKKEVPNKALKSDKTTVPNKVLPTFTESLPLLSTTSSILTNFNKLAYSLGFSVSQQAHLFRTQKINLDIKKILIIGVHGFFPTKMIRPLIGEPTGTSIKFANEAEKVILKWIRKENMNVTIQKIALEKEGKIFDRVEFFYQVMKKWQNDVNNADYIYIAAHSQGCPVSILLLARLIEDGILDLSNKRVSLLSMAGINNGPFYGADQTLFFRAFSKIESESMMELFQFQKFDSVHSKEYLRSLEIVTKNNVKITFVGSINDQLVPLYSSTCAQIRHPNIFRATYIDGGSNTPDFVSRTVSIANHLHNLGLTDHGIIKEISNSLAGPLTGGGHSSIYNDSQVYQLALDFSLYTTDLKVPIAMQFKPYNVENLGTNPYHLPWCMRGLLFEARNNIKGGDEEVLSLFEEFELWKPQTKQLKEMKYRLSGMRSKL